MQWVVLPALIAAASGALAQSAEFIPSGVVTTDGAARATAISADGRCVVGILGGTGVLWCPPALPVVIPPLLGDAQCAAYGVSADGTIVVGRSGRTYPFRSFIWTAAGGSQPLPLPIGIDVSAAVGVNSTGTTIVGNNQPNGGTTSGYWWTPAGGMRQLYPLFEQTEVRALSRNGLVAVGWLPAPLFRAAKWTAANAITNLPMPIGGTYSTAEAVNDQGDVIVGAVQIEGIQRAFRWTAAGGTELIGAISAQAFGVSADGTVVVGTMNPVPFAGTTPMIWTPWGGMRLLVEVLSEAGLNTAGWHYFPEARVVSADGGTIAGYGTRGIGGVQELWLARIPARPPCAADFNHSGGVGVQDIFDFLTAYFAGEFIADFNHSNSVTLQDIFDFLAAYFTGCP